jgi:hypothetical protein
MNIAGQNLGTITENLAWFKDTAARKSAILGLPVTKSPAAYVDADQANAVKYWDNKVMYPQSFLANSAPTKHTVLGGKVFGIFGYGDNNMPDKTAPFVYKDISGSANARPGMMVSLFPYDGAVTADTGDIIEIEATEKDITSAIYTAPAQPAAAEAIKESTGAQFLAAGMIAVSAVAATLF